MAQVISTLCDWHLAKKDEQVSGTPRRIPLEGLRKPAIDLCDACYEERIQQHVTVLAALGEELGRREDASTPPINFNQKRRRTREDVPTDQLVQCPFKGCEHKVINRGALREHCTSEHGKSLAIIEGELGFSAEGQKIEHYCTTCPAGFTTAQGLGAHRHTEHGEAGTSAGATAKKAAKKTAKKAG